MNHIMLVKHVSQPYPEDKTAQLSYYLFSLPLGSRTAWSILALCEEDGVVLESRFLCDLTSDAKRAKALFRRCVGGRVLPRELDEVIEEAMALQN